MAIDSKGVLYGTTITGSPVSGGVAFSLTPPAAEGHPWTQSVLYYFVAAGIGMSPSSNVVIGFGGSLYGTTSEYGSVYALAGPSTPGGSWTPYPLHIFRSYPEDAFNPGEGITVGKGGVLYGTSEAGGAYGIGTVYSVTPPTKAGERWTEQVLYSFGNTGDGTYPASIPVIGGDGVIYGTTSRGALGAENGCGLVFSLTLPVMQGGSWTETKL